MQTTYLILLHPFLRLPAWFQSVIYPGAISWTYLQICHLWTELSRLIKHWKSIPNSLFPALRLKTECQQQQDAMASTSSSCFFFFFFFKFTQGSRLANVQAHFFPQYISSHTSPNRGIMKILGGSQKFFSPHKHLGGGGDANGGVENLTLLRWPWKNGHNFLGKLFIHNFHVKTGGADFF